MVDIHKHHLFLELKELKKCDMIITRLWEPPICKRVSIDVSQIEYINNTTLDKKDKEGDILYY